MRLSAKYHSYDFKESHQRNVENKDPFLIHMFKEVLTGLFTADLLISGGYCVYHLKTDMMRIRICIVLRTLLRPEN